MQEPTNLQEHTKLETVKVFLFEKKKSFSVVRAIFNWVSKIIRDCISFALLCFVIGLENSRHPLSQSDAKLKPIAIWSRAFSRA